MKRRHFVAAIAALCAAPAWSARRPLVEVWRTASCGCCGAWVAHIQKNGFATRVHVVDDVTPIRRALGIPEELVSCHTARVDGYAIEGHVPAGDIRKLLATRPRARGLAAPGMPAAAPGMDVPGSPSYEVVLVGLDDSVRVFARH